MKNRPSLREELAEIAFAKDPQLKKSDKEILSGNAVPEKAGGILAGFGGLYGGIAGARAVASIKKQLDAQGAGFEALHPKLKGASLKKVALIGTGAGALMGASGALIPYLALKSRQRGLKKYPESIGESGRPGYSDSYKKNRLRSFVKEYNRKPKELSAKEELELILLSNEDKDRWYNKAARIGGVSAIGGLAGRVASYKPLIGGKMNRGTLIGAGIGALGQTAIEGIASSKKGRYGAPLNVPQEARQRVREQGSNVAKVGLAGAAALAVTRIKKDADQANEEVATYKQNVTRRTAPEVRIGNSSIKMPQFFMDPKPILNDDEFGNLSQKIKQRMDRHEGRDSGERFIPKFKKREEPKAGSASYRGVNETGGDLEAKLERLAKRAKGTPEGEVAAKKLHALRSRGGKTFGSKVQRKASSVMEKIRSVLRKAPRGRQTAGAIKMLMSSREELNSIIELGFREEAAKRIAAIEGKLSGYADRGASALNRAGAAIGARNAIGVEAAANGLKLDAVREGVRNLPKAAAMAAGAGVRTGSRQAGRYLRGVVSGEAGHAPGVSDYIKSGMDGAGDFFRSGKGISSATLRNAAIGGGAIVGGAGIYRAAGYNDRRDKRNLKFQNKVLRAAKKANQQKIALMRDQHNLSARDTLDIIMFGRVSRARDAINGYIEHNPHMAAGLAGGAAFLGGTFIERGKARGKARRSDNKVVGQRRVIRKDPTTGRVSHTTENVTAKQKREDDAAALARYRSGETRRIQLPKL